MINKWGIQYIIFDFDGVFTDNRVMVDQNGIESVVCNRSDGWAIQALHKCNFFMTILTSEKNSVVRQRAEKLNLPIIDGALNKAEKVSEMFRSGICLPENTLYVGNDVNDYTSMKMCKYSACPLDSHREIKKIAFFQLKKKGGEGVAMEIAEEILGIDLIGLVPAS